MAKTHLFLRFVQDEKTLEIHISPDRLKAADTLVQIASIIAMQGVDGTFDSFIEVGTERGVLEFEDNSYLNN